MYMCVYIWYETEIKKFPEFGVGEPKLGNLKNYIKKKEKRKHLPISNR